MLSYELREHVLDYINGQLEYEELEDWYVPRLREFLKDPHSPEADVIAAIEQAAVHLADKLSSEEEIKDMLWDALGRHSEVMHLDLTAARPLPGHKVSIKSTTSTAGDTIKVPTLSQRKIINALQISHS